MKGAYFLKGIDPELWRKFKTACAYYNISIKDVFIQHAHNIVMDFEAHKRSEDLEKSKSGKGGNK